MTCELVEIWWQLWWSPARWRGGRDGKGDTHSSSNGRTVVLMLTLSSVVELHETTWLSPPYTALHCCASCLATVW